MPRSRVCVLDAGPIIHLDELGRLDLLRALGELFVPETVAGEAELHRPGVMERLQVSAVPDFENTSAEVTIAAARRNLHAGEIAALSWADAFGTDLFVSDDRMARLAAEDLGYETAGTLGVIRIAAEEGNVSTPEAISILQSIAARSTLHVTPSLVAEVIARLR